jgi:hypothetical protein
LPESITRHTDGEGGVRRTARRAVPTMRSAAHAAVWRRQGEHGAQACGLSKTHLLLLGHRLGLWRRQLAWGQIGLGALAGFGGLASVGALAVARLLLVT